MIMKKSSEENMIKRERKLCVTTLMTKKISFKKKQDKRKREKHDNLDDNKKRNS